MADSETELSAAVSACVVVVDDERDVRAVVARALRRAGIDVVQYSSAEQALDALEAAREEPDAILTDLHMEHLTGIDLLERARDTMPHVPVVIMTGQATVSSAVDAMKRGAHDYLTKPFDPPAGLVATVERAIRYRRLLERNKQLEQLVELSDRFRGIIGESKAMQRVFALADSVAPTDATVLVLGESGTGKELIARAIHDKSDRASRPFVAVNCGALTETVLESELFGHVKGAFTGAVGARRGLFEEAHGGTLLLDEIGELSPAMQVRLLRVLQEGEIRPVGSSQSKRVDVRVIAATHRDLRASVDEGAFRQDLYYRLNVFSIDVPPLRDRMEDVPLLVKHFIEKHSVKLKKEVTGITVDALQDLSSRTWPGNIRELENAVERAIVLAREGVVTEDVLPAEDRPSGAQPVIRGNRRPLADAKADFERRYVEEVLAEADGKTSEAARLAGMDRSNFRRLLKRYGIAASGNGD